MRPEAVAVDGQGNVYVTDGPPSARICKFDSKGRFLGMWGSKGVGDGQFMETIDIVIDQQGNVYISDYGNNRINKFRQR
jgi:tripartite motif-containing protein 71